MRESAYAQIPVGDEVLNVPIRQLNPAWTYDEREVWDEAQEGVRWDLVITLCYHGETSESSCNEHQISLQRRGKSDHITLSYKSLSDDAVLWVPRLLPQAELGKYSKHYAYVITDFFNDIPHCCWHKDYIREGFDGRGEALTSLCLCRKGPLFQKVVQLPACYVGDWVPCSRYDGLHITSARVGLSQTIYGTLRAGSCRGCSRGRSDDRYWHDGPIEFAEPENLGYTIPYQTAWEPPRQFVHALF